jgi:hypothetical protein
MEGTWKGVCGWSIGLAGNPRVIRAHVVE